MWTKDEMDYGPIEDLITELADQLEITENMSKDFSRFPPMGVAAQFSYLAKLLKTASDRIEKMAVDMRRIKGIIGELKTKPRNN